MLGESARERGILLESHAQNTLLEIDRNFRPTRVVHRDCDVWIDSDARRHAGLDVPFLGSGIGSGGGHPVEHHYSLVYDRPERVFRVPADTRLFPCSVLTRSNNCYPYILF